MDKENDKRPRVIDLYSGVGGLSLGGARAGFDVCVAVENDPQASETHKKNFPNCIHHFGDVSALTGNDLYNISGLSPGEIDGIIGGPPCQGFSTIGRQDDGDKRNFLFYHFFRLVNEIRPSFFLAENVPGILNSKHDSFRQKALSQIPDNYIILKPLKIVANEYGVPTIRTRIFFIGYDPERFHELSESDFAPDLDTEKTTVEDALYGLPKYISPEWQVEKQGWRKVRQTCNSVFMKKVSGEVPYGVGHKESLHKYFKLKKVSGCLGTRHSDKVSERYANVEPGKSDKISKSVKLNLKGFCPTLRAGTGKDRGSYQAVRPLHPTRPRVITPREAARLQGFPDWFVFHKTKWHSFRQIGNSVSPIIGERILQVIREKIVRHSNVESIYTLEDWKLSLVQENFSF